MSKQPTLKKRQIATAKVITFRSQTVGYVSDFIGDEGLKCQNSHDVLCYLASALLNYQEEGISLSPKILFCSEADKIFKSFPGTISYRIGETDLAPDSAKRVLKDCASLTSNHWFIYMNRLTAERMEYGLFRYVRSPTALPIEEAITVASNLICILIKKTSSSAVELKGSKGHSLSVVFSTLRDAEPDLSHISEFVTDCTAALPVTGSDDFRAYFTTLLNDALVRCHGTILVSTKDASLKSKELKDHVAVVPALDFWAVFCDYRDLNTAESVLRLQSCEELLRGMLSNDGIIVFDTRCRILAYRCFYRPNRAAKMQDNERNGGARTRAYEGVKSLIGNSLTATLFRSQDGLTLHDRS